ncbi:GNAT family N-acetyltransferase [soil metagenome]
MTMNVKIREIAKEDNPVIAEIIRNALTEFGVNKPGTVFTDPSTDHLFELYQQSGSTYFIAEVDGDLAGGAGIGPIGNPEEKIVELQKMYLRKEHRNKGIARMLMDHCLSAAKNFGYTNCYLETMPELKNAIGLYEHFGFQRLKAPVGNSGHFSCDIWMMKKI